MLQGQLHRGCPPSQPWPVPSAHSAFFPGCRLRPLCVLRCTRKGFVALAACPAQTDPDQLRLTAQGRNRTSLWLLCRDQVSPHTCGPQAPRDTGSAPCPTCSVSRTPSLPSLIARGGGPSSLGDTSSPQGPAQFLLAPGDGSGLGRGPTSSVTGLWTPSQALVSLRPAGQDHRPPGFWLLFLPSESSLGRENSGPEDPRRLSTPRIWASCKDLESWLDVVAEP